MSSIDFEFDLNDIFKIENLTCDNYHYISRIKSESLIVCFLKMFFKDFF